MLNVSLLLFGYGGVEPAAHDCLFAELIQPSDVAWAHRIVYDDALIERSRSVALSRAVQAKADVVVFLDHDITWEPGDVARLAQKAHETNAIVGGLYACRGYRAGFASRAAEEKPWKPGGDLLHKAEYIATGFIAIPRRCAERILACCQRPDAPADVVIRDCIGVDRPEITFNDYFRCISVPCTMAGYEDKYELLSEDWSFCKRASFSDVPLYLWEKPLLRHYGRHGFRVDDGFRGGAT